MTTLTDLHDALTTMRAHLEALDAVETPEGLTLWTEALPALQRKLAVVFFKATLDRNGPQVVDHLTEWLAASPFKACDWMETQARLIEAEG